MVWFGIAISLIILYALSLLFFKVKQIFKPQASIILIIYNAENTIEGIIRYIGKMQQNSKKEFEVIVIDHNSLDQTPLILQRLAIEFSLKFFQTEQKEENPLDLGIKHASSNVIYYMEIEHDKEPMNGLLKFYNELQEIKSDSRINGSNGRIKKIAG